MKRIDWNLLSASDRKAAMARPGVARQADWAAKKGPGAKPKGSTAGQEGANAQR